MQVEYDTLTLGHGQKVDVLETYTYNDYDGNTHQNDIILLKTSSMTLGSMNAQAINLPMQSYSPFPNIMLNISGFGLCEMLDSDQESNVNLNIAQVSILSEGDCRVYYPYMDEQKHFCAGGNNVTSGNGDEGGPGAENRQLDGIILTYSDKPENRPDLFTNVGYHVSWIKRHINSTES